MTIKFIVGVLDGEITDTVFSVYMTANQCEEHFPLGEVYRYAEETPGNMYWRILQRRSVEGKITVWYAQWLPVGKKDVPEVVRMIAMLHE